jgi:hypothetical protein
MEKEARSSKNLSVVEEAMMEIKFNLLDEDEQFEFTKEIVGFKVVDSDSEREKYGEEEEIG